MYIYRYCSEVHFCLQTSKRLQYLDTLKQLKVSNDACITHRVTVDFYTKHKKIKLMLLLQNLTY